MFLISFLGAHYELGSLAIPLMNRPRFA
jgi:hypothetical protein